MANKKPTFDQFAAEVRAMCWDDLPGLDNSFQISGYKCRRHITNRLGRLFEVVQANHKIVKMRAWRWAPPSCQSGNYDYLILDDVYVAGFSK